MVFTYSWNRYLIHKGHENEIHPQHGSYNFGGFIIPFDERFYEEDYLKNVDFMILKQIPWTLHDLSKPHDKQKQSTKSNQKQQQKQSTKSYQKQSKKNKTEEQKQGACIIDSTLNFLFSKCYLDAISYCSYGMKGSTIPYWGCSLCFARKAHICAPWQPLLGAAAPLTFVISSPKASLTEAIKQWEACAADDLNIRKLLIYFYIQTLTSAQIIMKTGDRNEKNELCSSVRYPKIKYNVFNKLNFNNLHYVCNDVQELFDFEKSNDTSNLNPEEKKAANHLQSPIYCKLTEMIAFDVPTIEEDPFWFRTQVRDRQKYKDQSLYKKTYTESRTLPYQTLQQV